MVIFMGMLNVSGVACVQEHCDGYRQMVHSAQKVQKIGQPLTVDAPISQVSAARYLLIVNCDVAIDVFVPVMTVRSSLEADYSIFV